MSICYFVMWVYHYVMSFGISLCGFIIMLCHLAFRYVSLSLCYVIWHRYVGLSLCYVDFSFRYVSLSLCYVNLLFRYVDFSFFMSFFLFVIFKEYF